jgi:uncharacterized protein YbcI
MTVEETRRIQAGPPARPGDISPAHSEAGARLSRRLTEFYKDLYGRGPTAVSTVISPELAATAMHEILTAGEQTLVAGGKVAEVEGMRLRTAEIMRPQLIALAEEALGVEVATSVTGISAGENLATETFLLLPKG